MTQAEFDAARARINKTPAPKPKSRPKGKESEDLLALQLAEAGIQAAPEFRFHQTRRWRFDFAIEGAKLAIEIDGGNWAPGGGRHGGDPDREKIAEAAIAGWRVIRASPKQVRDGTAIGWVEAALLGGKNFCEHSAPPPMDYIDV